ncbi:MAG: MBL fold metallo-hydrolase [Candidatus Omnitrophota bacterium]|jgi:7,8-dihydropterin-6-yl-methyl-4-(beta-D-ribofuranosyl)aminobenzene 5'-phosphate synthase
MQIKILFDKEKLNETFESGWGISYLIGDVLFDTGEKPEYLLHNMEVFGVKPQDLKKVVISHNHWDHRAGLWDLLEMNKNLEVYGCSDFYDEFKEKLKNYNFIKIEVFQEIAGNIYTTGPFKALHKGSVVLEQALILKKEEEISILCACGHMGLVDLINKAKDRFPGKKINLLLGGFHFIEADMRMAQYVVSETKKLGVEKIAPAHCTGNEVAQLFKDLYGKNFIIIKTGTEIQI